MDKKKIGFFKKIILAITDFRFYPHVLKNESTSQSFWHFVAFLMLLTLIISIKVTGLVYDKLDVFLAQYDALVPEFVIDMGILDVDYVGTKEIRNDIVAPRSNEERGQRSGDGRLCPGRSRCAGCHHRHRGGRGRTQCHIDGH